MRRLFWVIAVVFAAAILVTGCDDDGTGEAKTYDRTMALDNGEYQKVLDMTKNCGGDQACLMDRAAAFIGLAGFTVPKVVKAITEESDESYFQLLTKTLEPTQGKNRLDSSRTTYISVLTVRGRAINQCDQAHYGVLNQYEKAACTNAGLASIVKSAAIASGIEDIMNTNPTCKTTLTLSDCNGITADDLKDLVDLLFNDSESIVGLISAKDSDTKEEIQKIKDELCDAAGELAGCLATAVSQDAILKWVKGYIK
ncbi:hypothetical protein FACS189487_01890 [Campylobacterota bacterium]|nr:hypothetical protein FACS189487_01890 [Campylobacterota bacterium]